MIATDDPRHGERAGYVAGCRDDCCRTPHIRYVKRYNMDQALGRPKRQVPAARAQAHVANMLRMMSAGAIADAAGVAENIITDIDARDVIYPRTERRILAVKSPRQASGRHRVNVVGSVRRVRALAVLGYSSHAIAAVAGLSACSIRLIQQEKSGATVEAATARAVALAYDALSMSAPVAPTPKARQAIPVVKRHAARNGWVPPLAWDDATIDDPDATPSGAGYKQGARIDEIRELEALGLTRAGIAARLGVTQNAIDRTIDRDNAKTGSTAA